MGAGFVLRCGPMMTPPRILLASFVALSVVLPPPARSGEAPPARADGGAAGVEVDLLPAVLSAVAGAPGGALQLWAGRGRDRLRLVGARLALPDGLTSAPFRDRRLTVVALLYDRFLRDGFRGPWIGGGLEAWWNRIGSERGPGTEAWFAGVATVGGGWVFPVWRGLYLNPWAAVHVPLAPPRVELYGERFDPGDVEAEASLKLGWGWGLER